MTDGRRLVALLLLSFAVGASLFGTVRGLAATGPGHGMRLVATIAPPVTDAVREMIEHMARERLDVSGNGARIVAMGDQLVVELGDDEPVIAAEVGALLERIP